MSSAKHRHTNQGLNILFSVMDTHDVVSILSSSGCLHYILYLKSRSTRRSSQDWRIAVKKIFTNAVLGDWTGLYACDPTARPSSILPTTRPWRTCCEHRNGRCRSAEHSHQFLHRVLRRMKHHSGAMSDLHDS